ncbi:MAG: AAA family ATPase [Methanobrevibacter sp.]|nr:AAA family ATPase [Clostridia bacterium]MBQ6628647.1 AAA family ATPase [Methanobrevibacter sp.]
MLLKSITLKNFRQFISESIEFASGEDGKNVTIIIGENGTGKTTFAQAFFWCLYGETEFSDKMMLNKMIASKMRPGQEETVMVELVLKHGDVEYTLTREQKYRKEYSGNPKPDNTVFDIAKKDSSGITAYVKKSQCEGEVKTILPKELSKYFFFDGERIENMSKDISSGKKSNDFAEAVKGLLGLNSMISAIGHFNPRSNRSVIGSYETSYDTSSNSKIAEKTRQINEYNTRIDNITARLEELENNIAAATERKKEKEKEIKQYEEGEKLQLQKESLERDIKNIERTKSNLYKTICKDFNNSMSPVFSLSLIKRALEVLSDEKMNSIDIPYMHTKTIEYLLHQGTCICGTHLDEGSTPYRKLVDLKEYLPPQSISTYISDFKKEAKRRTVAYEDDLMESVTENMAIISQQNDDIIDKADDLRSIEGKLSGDDVREKVKLINAEIRSCTESINKDTNEKNHKIFEQGQLTTERDRADAERRNFTLLDDRNKKIELYKTYANRIYQELNDVYKDSEAKIRNKLQDTINDIFKSIYEGGLYLTIDERYHISVYANDYEGDVETSTAQSISVIFAFITGIIKMARENRNATDENAKLLTSEPYPLVMDAPLSAFDKRRIKTVCKALPETAEQVVIFIKDTDGELAEEYMGDRIGKRHKFDKKNEFETILV